MTTWLECVKAYQAQNNCSYKDALKGASAVYTKKTKKNPEKTKKKKNPKVQKVITAETEESDDSENYI
jgi:hypothetical protein